MRLLGVTAVAYEADAVVGGLRWVRNRVGPYDERVIDAHGTEIVVVVGGVGPAAAAAATASILAADGPFDLVISLGIAGAFPGRGATIGDLVVATEIVPADLGIRLEDGFVDPLSLDWLPGPLTTASALVDAAVDRGAIAGPVLTVSCMTGADLPARELADRHPHAVAEAMEGAGVGLAAHRWGAPFGELRAISNLVGAYNKNSWDKAAALERLSQDLPRLVQSLG